MLLDKLRSAPTLEYFANEVLAKLAPEHRDEILGFLLARAAAGGEIRAISYDEFNVDLLGGATGEELLALLRRVRDAMLDPNADGCATKHPVSTGGSPPTKTLRSPYSLSGSRRARNRESTPPWN